MKCRGGLLNTTMSIDRLFSGISDTNIKFSFQYFSVRINLEWSLISCSVPFDDFFHIFKLMLNLQKINLWKSTQLTISGLFSIQYISLFISIAAIASLLLGTHLWKTIHCTVGTFSIGVNNSVYLGE